MRFIYWHYCRLIPWRNVSMCELNGLPALLIGPIKHLLDILLNLLEGVCTNALNRTQFWTIFLSATKYEDFLCMETATSVIPGFVKAGYIFPGIISEIMTFDSCENFFFLFTTNWKYKVIWNKAKGHAEITITSILFVCDFETVFIEIQNAAKIWVVLQLEYLILQNLTGIPAHVVKFTRQLKEFRLLIDSADRKLFLQSCLTIRLNKVIGLHFVRMFFLNLFLITKGCGLLLDRWGILFVNHVLKLFLLLLNKLFYVTVHLHSFLFLRL